MVSDLLTHLIVVEFFIACDLAIDAQNFLEIDDFVSAEDQIRLGYHDVS